MIQRFSKEIVRWMNKHGFISGEQEIYEYGLMLIMSYTVAVLMIMGYAIYQNALLEAVIFITVFGNLRKHTGGYHAKTFFTCNLSFLALFILTFHLTKILLPLDILVIIALIILIYISPVTHKNKPISQDEIKYYQGKAQLSLLFYSVIMQVCKILEWSSVVTMIQLTIVLTALLAVLGWITERKEQDHESHISNESID